MTHLSIIGIDLFHLIDNTVPGTATVAVDPTRQHHKRLLLEHLRANHGSGWAVATIDAAEAHKELFACLPSTECPPAYINALNNAATVLLPSSKEAADRVSAERTAQQSVIAKPNAPAETAEINKSARGGAHYFSDDRRLSPAGRRLITFVDELIDVSESRRQQTKSALRWFFQRPNSPVNLEGWDADKTIAKFRDLTVEGLRNQHGEPSKTVVQYLRHVSFVVMRYNQANPNVLSTSLKPTPKHLLADHGEELHAFLASLRMRGRLQPKQVKPLQIAVNTIYRNLSGESENEPLDKTSLMKILLETVTTKTAESCISQLRTAERLFAEVCFSITAPESSLAANALHLQPPTSIGQPSFGLE